MIQDLNLLQQALGLNEWSLFGVSYGAVYALLYADEYADNVDTLILDSPAFPAFKEHEGSRCKVFTPLTATG
ncbi:alpha/beta hydrolase [Alishewanella longhuensis]